MKRSSVFMPILVLALTALLPAQALAASADISLVPNVSSAVTDNTVTVTVNEDSGTEPVNAVQANLSYPAASLQYVSVSNNATFSIDAQTSINNGTVKLARGTYTAVTGVQPVTVVTFKVIGSSGTADLSFISGTAVVSATSHTNIVSSESGTSLSISSPTTTDPSTSSNNTNSSSSSNTNTTSQTPSTSSTSCSTSCDTPQDPASTSDSSPNTTTKPTTALVNTGMNLASVLGISGLATAASYVVALSYRKLTQR